MTPTGARAERDTGVLQRAEELLGVMFTTPKDLRHKAEQVLGQLFVPTELLRESSQAADLVLRPAGVAEIHVHARRERHWYPFQVTRVDAVAR